MGRVLFFTTLLISQTSWAKLTCVEAFDDTTLLVTRELKSTPISTEFRESFPVFWKLDVLQEVLAKVIYYQIKYSPEDFRSPLHVAWSFELLPEKKKQMLAEHVYRKLKEFTGDIASRGHGTVDNVSLGVGSLPIYRPNYWAWKFIGKKMRIGLSRKGRYPFTRSMDGLDLYVEKNKDDFIKMILVILDHGLSSPRAVRLMSRKILRRRIPFGQGWHRIQAMDKIGPKLFKELKNPLERGSNLSLYEVLRYVERNFVLFRPLSSLEKSKLKELKLSPYDEVSELASEILEAERK